MNRQQSNAEPTPIVRRAKIVRLADVQPEPIQWLWENRIAVGKLTVLAGDPGLGKSFLTLDIASRVSTGSGWPDIPNNRFLPGGVVLLSAEDDVADTIRPRLDAAGANASRVIALQSVKNIDPGTGAEMDTTFSLAIDLPALEDAIGQVEDCRLVVIDPITAYTGTTDSHKNAEVRGLLAPLSELAAKLHVAIVAVTHLNKSAAGPAIYRTMGSLAFTAAARAVWGVVKDPQDPQRRLMLPVKNNIAQDATGLAYSIQASGLNTTPYLTWEAKPVDMSADEAMAPADRRDSNKVTERDEAKAWLREALADGPVAAGLIRKMSNEAGHAWGTVRRAKDDLRVKAQKAGFGDDGIWCWVLPGQTCAVDPPSTHVRTLEDGERLNVAGNETDESWPDLHRDGSKDAHLYEGAHPEATSIFDQEPSGNEDGRGGLTERPKARKGEALAVLQQANRKLSRKRPSRADDAPTIYTAEERRVLDGAGIGPGEVPISAAAKAAFPEAVVIGDKNISQPELPNARQEAAQLIRQARRSSTEGIGIAKMMRDTWRERMAIASVDGELSRPEAESIARDEIKNILADWQVK
jgi:hypothetical protein